MTEPIIGLEVHIELKTESKMFCSCPVSHFQAKPNTQTCPVCLGLPGSLPVPNQKAIEWTILIGLALNCEIQLSSKFDRKNYFYPDLPKGYQISQYDMPLAINGNWKMPDGKSIRIRRVHLEEDTGKLIHREGSTLVDFNRAGVPLVEIVTEPDFHSAAEAKEFIQKLQQIVRYLEAADANMEKGEMRCEPNVNLKITADGKEFFTPIVEIKNINSFKFVEKTINYEIERQQEEFEKTKAEKASGNKSNRGWNEKQQITVPQRSKEEAEDYRYFPEPDIPPINFIETYIEDLKQEVVELPVEKVSRLTDQYGLTQEQAEILTKSSVVADYFEETAALGKGKVETKEIANWIINKRVDINTTEPSSLIQAISQKAQPSSVPEVELEKIVEEVIEQNPQSIADFQKGKNQALEFLVGQTARLTQGKSDPNLARQLFLKKLPKKG